MEDLAAIGEAATGALSVPLRVADGNEVSVTMACDSEGPLEAAHAAIDRTTAVVPGRIIYLKLIDLDEVSSAR